MPSPSSSYRSRPCSLPPSPPATPTLPVAPLPRLEAFDSAAHCTQPPPGALVFPQHLHRPPRKLGRAERAKVWYDGLLFETLEPWESLLVHLLLLSLILFAYLALSRLFAPARLARVDARWRWYLTGRGGAGASTGYEGGAFAVQL
ncbi:hypothetical protein JCM10450v2_006922 [Rhodotorula kratochvilovae]